MGRSRKLWKMVRGVPWVAVVALIAAQSLVGASWAGVENEAREVELLEEAESNPHLAGLHDKNHDLLRQIDDVENGRHPTPATAAPMTGIGPAGPAPMPGMMAV